MSDLLTARQSAIIHAFVACTEPSDSRDREEMREALFASDEFYYRLAALNLPLQELLGSIYEFMQSECDNASGLANCISEFAQDPSYLFSAGFILHYMANDPEPGNWHSGLYAEVSLFLEGYDTDDGEYLDRLQEIIAPLADKTVASKIVSKFFELAEFGPKNIKGQSFSQVLDEASLLPK